MKDSRTILCLLLAGFILAACGNGKTFNPLSGSESPYVEGSDDSGAPESSARKPAKPSPRKEAGVPMPELVALKKPGSAIDQAFYGKTVSLNAMVYDASAASVLSSVVDAMTALNMPVQRVDSTSGTITTEWIWQGADNENITLIEGKRQTLRYRFSVLVLRLKDSAKTKLVVRTLAQTRIAKKWVDSALKRRASEELFAAVQEQLARVSSKPVASFRVEQPPGPDAAPKTEPAHESGPVKGEVIRSVYPL